MGNQNSSTQPANASSTTTEPQQAKDQTEGDKQNEEKPKCKPCCACPETRKARDMCIIERGEEECTELIEAHKECMRKLGFRVA